jgi:hypothetical protein
MSEEIEDVMIEKADRDFEAGKLAVKTICDASNGGRCQSIVNGMIDQLRYEHRTLQQDFWRAIKLVAIEYSKFNHDLRNEAAVEFCQKITKIDEGIPRY